MIPNCETYCFDDVTSRCCLLIPVINEGERLLNELIEARQEKVSDLCDIVICDGGSNDGSVEPDTLRALGVNSLLVMKDEGHQGSQLRMGISYALGRGYDFVLTVDGNNKDSIGAVFLILEKLIQGYDFVQGSRYVEGGMAINTPPARYLAGRLIHAPITSIAAGHHFTDTTNAFRGYRASLLNDARIAPLRDVFDGYELLAYLPIRACRLGYAACEVPVARKYPKRGKTPTKISKFSGNVNLLKVLFKASLGMYNPPEEVS